MENIQNNPYNDYTTVADAPTVDLTKLPQEDVERMMAAWLASPAARDPQVRLRWEQRTDDRSFLASQMNLALEGKKATVWIDQASRRPDPVELYGELWYEGECSCLFADTNVGKSLLAVDIAQQIAAKGKRVLYIDFELSDKQFQLRYTDDDGRTFPFSDNFIRAEMAPQSLPDSILGMCDLIELCALRHRCKVIIIDNISWICNRAECGDAAGELMQRLTTIKRRWGFSLLCIAHTPKRAGQSPLTQNSLAGSKRIANFMDSIFALGIDYTNAPNGRYIKQIKVRNCPLSYGDDNVITCRIARQGALLCFDTTGYSDEITLLNLDDKAPDNTARNTQVLDLHRQGLSTRLIATRLCLSQSMVSRIIKQS